MGIPTSTTSLFYKGEAVLVDFDCTERVGVGSGELQREIAGLRQELKDTPGRGRYDVEDDEG